MKTPLDIVAFVDDLQRKMLRRPSMYAGTPESLEEQLELLELLRSFVVDDKPVRRVSSAYREYAEKTATVGPLSYTRKRHNEIWREFCEFFASYLESQGRIGKRSTRHRDSRRRM